MRRIRHRPELNVVLIGDKHVGKTQFLKTYSVNSGYGEENNYGDPYYKDIVPEKKKSVRLKIYDTPGDDSCLPLRRFYYGEANVIFICYSVDDVQSLENVSQKWLPEAKEYSDDVTVVLMACKIDLRDKNVNTITEKEGMEMAKKLGMRFFETSALKTEEEINDKLQEVLAAELKKIIRKIERRERKNNCVCCLILSTFCCWLPCACLYDKIKD